MMKIRLFNVLEKLWNNLLQYSINYIKLKN
jgi:hypothetical protein